LLSQHLHQAKAAAANAELVHDVLRVLVQVQRMVNNTCVNSSSKHNAS
jgi:hypothetical protein